ncbi:hypothetical protein SAMN05421754_1001257 [Nitrosomonas sp. Nm58]|nr:hypothetical protein SAMN05421754_1001257 [Nitrosomonas sp. Nm58]
MGKPATKWIARFSAHLATSQLPGMYFESLHLVLSLRQDKQALRRKAKARKKTTPPHLAQLQFLFLG